MGRLSCSLCVQDPVKLVARSGTGQLEEECLALCGRGGGRDLSLTNIGKALLNHPVLRPSASGDVIHLFPFVQNEFLPAFVRV